MSTFLIPKYGFENFFPKNSNYFPKILEDDGKYIFKQDLPGYKKSEIKIVAKKGLLEIAAENESEDKDTIRSFEGSFSLPEGINYEIDPEAKYENGVLQISFQKLPEQKKKSLEKTIKIK